MTLRWNVLLAAAIALPSFAGAAERATATLRNADGATVGAVSLTQFPSGVLLHARLQGLPPGVHAFHVHGVGQCEPPYTSAGGHFNPAGAKHGVGAADGPHAGDMPNIHVPESGALEIEVFNTLLALDDRLFDADGAAIMIHAGADDYRSDPAGDAGPRIACGVIER